MKRKIHVGKKSKEYRRAWILKGDHPGPYTARLINGDWYIEGPGVGHHLDIPGGKRQMIQSWTWPKEMKDYANNDITNANMIVEYHHRLIHQKYLDMIKIQGDEIQKLRQRIHELETIGCPNCEV